MEPVTVCHLSQELYTVHPLALQMKLNESRDDQPTYNEIARMPKDEQDLWTEAMNKEIQALVRFKCFEIVNQAKAAG